MKLTLTYIWSQVWPRVVLDDGSTPAVRCSLKNASILETEHDSSTLAFSRYTFSIKGKVRQFLLTKVSLLFLGSIAQPVTTVCENVTRKPDIQTKYVQTSLHGHCWWKSSVELYHRKSRMQHLKRPEKCWYLDLCCIDSVRSFTTEKPNICIICFNISSFFLFDVSHREDWMMSQGNPLWRSTQDVLHIRWVSTFDYDNYMYVPVWYIGYLYGSRSQSGLAAL